MNNKTKILTAVVGVIVVGLGVTLMQPITSDLQEPIVPVMVEETQEIEIFEEVEEIEETEEEPAPEEIGEADSIEVITEPEPEPVVEVAQAQVTEPTPVTEAIIEAPLVLEEQATYEPAPQEPAEQLRQEVQTYAEEPIVVPEVVTAPAPSSSGAYIGGAWCNGTYYEVTQAQMDQAYAGRIIASVDGIPSQVFIEIKNAGVTSGTSGLTLEEFQAQRQDTSLDADTKIVWK